jgi:phospho-N-acetylmuramoyl-pentapeptide-transferase
VIHQAAQIQVYFLVFFYLVLALYLSLTLVLLPMLLWILDVVRAVSSWELSALEKTTLRASLAALVSFLFGIACGPAIIAWLGAWARERIVSDSPQVRRLHEAKQNTPTMAGLWILAGLLVSLLFLGDWANPYLHLAILLALALAALGATDDLAKSSCRQRGLSARVKLLTQTVVATCVSLLAFRLDSELPGAHGMSLPALDGSVSLGWLFVPLSVLVIVGTSNAVNLTDGLDGLAAGCLIFSLSAMALVAHASGHGELSPYLGTVSIPGTGELVVVSGALIGGLLAFLWFNCHPAQVFMGDTGSLSLGGLLGLMAVLCRQQALLVLIGGVFVVEALSVILQVSLRWCTGRRFFLCAPLHHHFQLLGWPENRIVVRFWIAAALCGIAGAGALKLKAHDAYAPGPVSTAARDDDDGLRDPYFLPR